MAISFQNALGIHDSALRIRAQRAEVIAENLANADTPNYKARDLDFQSMLQNQQQLQSRGLEMNVNNDMHRPGGATLFTEEELMYRNPLAPSVDGNTVEAHVEHAKYMENSLAFQSSFTFLNSKFKGLMTAIRGE
ncbi:flagellar basal body rod protein FlgB [uncultured Pseudoteredinibacter sp.]|uniref:flagellar basal body rod protein FlgB n=1 Tax=uncultured Pseudoteredinibacter sp. TaxID=1641701 RepID=UPI0026326865|nr:flagellar basal body rod protein FlgB [uncultured Pseudoteredinibacter sp.]